MTGAFGVAEGTDGLGGLVLETVKHFVQVLDADGLHEPLTVCIRMGILDGLVLVKGGMGAGEIRSPLNGCVRLTCMVLGGRSWL